MDEFRRLLLMRLGAPARRGALAELERESGVRANVIGRWLADKPMEPSRGNLKRIAPALGVPYTTLVQMVYAADAADSPDRPSPPDYRDRLLRVSEMLLQVADELRAVAVGSPSKAPVALLDGNAEMPAQPRHHYVWQDWRLQLVPTGPAPLMFPRSGDQLQQCAA